jgi:hypothetical protein
MLMINNHFARFQLPGNLLKAKKMCSLFSWQHAISYLFSFALVLATCDFQFSRLSNQSPRIVWVSTTSRNRPFSVSLSYCRWLVRLVKCMTTVFLAEIVNPVSPAHLSTDFKALCRAFRAYFRVLCFE